MAGTAAAVSFPAGPAHPGQSSQEWSQRRGAVTEREGLDSGGDLVPLRRLHLCFQRTDVEDTGKTVGHIALKIPEFLHYELQN